ncbi:MULTISPECIES: hypothetical protein [Providencia]|uniref:hypothetical protein n=1 Tax=Providencia TaxID=586 RepID=UPI00044992DA|nr:MULTISPECIES: hypothetical protein [Providencia]ETT06204.1 fimbrial protein [Providencia alcalifaciens F90-2004]EUC93747.1 fimbrial protein [Providencia alcalifaciens PAL-2]EUD06718.1 fimbrial protein [Providencia alcalifaciens R90-1475]MBF0691205.1 hypothetical protein [Providencia alcalifaciens]MTB34137.1 hypothetical protein [Providencia alcalifaciens]
MNFITHKFFNLILVASVVGGTNINLAIAESANAIVQIKTTVLAGCTLDAPETVSLDNIPSSAFNGKRVGDNLTDYAKTFNLTATCSGTDKYKYTFQVTESDASCIKTNADFMRYCLKSNDKDINLSSTTATLNWDITKDGNITPITVIPQVASTTSTPVGEVNGQITITIEPM